MTKADTKPSKKVSVTKASSTVSKAKLTPTEQKILNAISTLKARSGGDGRVDRAKVHKLAGYNKTNGKEAKAFVNTLTKLGKHKGLIVFDSKTMDLTEAGEPLAEPTAKPRSRDEEIDKAKEGLKKGGQKAKDMVELLRDCGIHSREDIAKGLGYEHAKKKGFVNLLSIVKGEDVIKYVKDEAGNPGLQLADWLLENDE